jgi:hypothetical protein
MSKLQPEDNYEYDSEEDVTTEEEVVETEDSDEDQDTESAPEAGENPEKHITFSEDQQRILDEAVGKKVFKLREKEREAEALKKRLEELEARVPEQRRPNVPAIPDPFAVSDEEYRRQLYLRDEALKQAIAFDQQQQMLRQQKEQLHYQQQQKQQEALTERVQSYSQKATKLGIKAEDLQVAGNTVAQFGIHEDLVQYILEEDQGPLITTYLSKNLLELEKLREMSPTQAAVYVATTVKQKAAALKPKVNNAPDPLEQPHGAGKAPKPRGPQGAVFE